MLCQLVVVVDQNLDVCEVFSLRVLLDLDLWIEIEVEGFDFDFDF